MATVNLTKDTGKIEYVNPLPQGEPSPSEPGSLAILRVKGPDGSIRHEVSVAVKPSACCGSDQDRMGLVDAVIAVDPGARIIELLIAGRVVDTFQAGPTPPAVRALTSRPTERDALSFAWETDAKTGDKHTYMIQASTDNGQTWYTLAVGLTKPEVAIDHNQFHGAKQVLVRVFATDGFTRSTVATESVPIEAR